MGTPWYKPASVHGDLSGSVDTPTPLHTRGLSSATMRLAEFKVGIAWEVSKPGRTKRFILDAGGRTGGGFSKPLRGSDWDALRGLLEYHNATITQINRTVYDVPHYVFPDELGKAHLELLAYFSD